MEGASTKPKIFLLKQNDDISKFYRDVEIWKLAAEIEQRKTEMIDILTLLREIVIEFTPKPPEDAEINELRGLQRVAQKRSKDLDF